jgi:hypothetical protein
MSENLLKLSSGKKKFNYKLRLNTSINLVKFNSLKNINYGKTFIYGKN